MRGYCCQKKIATQYTIVDHIHGRDERRCLRKGERSPDQTAKGSQTAAKVPAKTDNYIALEGPNVIPRLAPSAKGSVLRAQPALDGPNIIPRLSQAASVLFRYFIGPNASPQLAGRQRLAPPPFLSVIERNIGVGSAPCRSLISEDIHDSQEAGVG